MRVAQSMSRWGRTAITQAWRPLVSLCRRIVFGARALHTRATEGIEVNSPVELVRAVSREIAVALVDVWRDLLLVLFTADDCAHAYPVPAPCVPAPAPDVSVSPTVRRLLRDTLQPNAPGVTRPIAA